MLDVRLWGNRGGQIPVNGLALEASVPLVMIQSVHSDCATSQAKWVASLAGNIVELAVQGDTDCVNDNDDR